MLTQTCVFLDRKYPTRAQEKWWHLSAANLELRKNIVFNLVNKVAALAQLFVTNRRRLLAHRSRTNGCKTLKVNLVKVPSTYLIYTKPNSKPYST